MEKGTLGYTVHMARYEKGMTQKELANIVRVDPSYISNIEKGKASLPSEDVLQRIASVLDLNFHDLLSLSGASIATMSSTPMENEDPAVSVFLQTVRDLKFKSGDLAAVSFLFEPQGQPQSGETCRELHYYRVMNYWQLATFSPSSSKGKRLRLIARTNPYALRRKSTFVPDALTEEDNF